jgi:nucleoside-diphosphate-sugar epimerase
MKVFIAGGTGAIGTRLIPRLMAEGHEVTAMTRSTAKAGDLRLLGAEVAVADALDREAVIGAVMRAEPEVVIHQLTALSGAKSLRRFDREFEQTNRLRTTGTDHLVDAARMAGARRLIAQSYGGWNYARTGSALKTEEDAFDPDPPANQRQSLAAIRHLEQAVLGAAPVEGVVLRYGMFYGPGNTISRDGDIAKLIRKRQFPLVGEAGGVWSFIHIDDAIAATIAALDRGTPGIYNVVDDRPAPVSEWLPELARVLGAKPPRHVPVWLGRLAAGEVGVSMMTRIRGTSNAKARRELGWEPRYRSYREGFRHGLDDQARTRHLLIGTSSVNWP